MYKILYICLLLVISSISPLTLGEDHSSKIVLVTGFEPFASYTVNPSALVAEALDGSMIDDNKIVGVVLPVDFNESSSIAIKEINRINPYMVISLGLSPKAKSIEIEVFAYNLEWDPFSDKPLYSFKPVIPSAPFVEKTNIDVLSTYSKIKENGIPTSISLSPGFYVCNSLFYNLLWYKEDNNLSMKVSFIHLPMIDDEFTVDDLIESASIAIEDNS
ncbi:MAG TPA: pyroglutamyl-peptidase I [Thermoplasmatales archaeon]|nr:pyroglutamyl-peptidase I [Thermoplasmatales archaeon]